MEYSKENLACDHYTKFGDPRMIGNGEKKKDFTKSLKLAKCTCLPNLVILAFWEVEMTKIN